jgi:glycosyltransferase involved in cell wall biosynthesis
MGRLHLRFPHGGTEFGGVDRVNHAIAAVLRETFEIVDDAARADLQLCAHDWAAPHPPRRLFVDHGAFADASFWACTAPRLRRDDAVLVTSAVCEAIAERCFAAERPALRRVPLFVDTALFHPAADRRRARRELEVGRGVPADGALLLTVAAYSRRKNLHLALRVLAEVRSRVPGTRLALVGRASPAQAEYAATIERLARELGLPHAVHLLPPMPHAELRDWMAACDALLHLTTCRIENFGLVVAEALAAGLPVIGADWGGLRDLVEHGASGYLARTWMTAGGPRVDWLAAAHATSRLLLDAGLAAEAGRHGAAFAREVLSPVAFARRLRATVGELLERPPGPPEFARLSPRGQDLMFATLRLQRARPEIASTSAEYRALLAEDPELCRWLTGPAASWEDPPVPEDDTRLYRVVAARLEPGRLRVVDPAWDSETAVTRDEAGLWIAADGRRLGEMADALGLSRATAREAAARLVAAGVLGPLSEGWPGRGPTWDPRPVPGAGPAARD